MDISGHYGQQTEFGNDLPKILKQKGENTCWLAVTKMVLYYWGESDTAESVAETGAEGPGSVADKLYTDFDITINIDKMALPEIEEMKDHFIKGGIFVSFLTQGKVENMNKGRTGRGVGHWIIINGVDTYYEVIRVVDPNPRVGNEIWIPYGPNYQPSSIYAPMHFVNTSYVDKSP